MAIKALLPVVMSISEFHVNYSPDINESDFSRLEIVQRDQRESHVKQFGEVIHERALSNPNLPVLETLLSVRLIPKNAASEERMIQDMLNGDLPSPKDVDKSYMVDGGHRWLQANRDIGEGMDYKLMFTLIVCDDDGEEEVFFNINGRGRKMAPALMDLSLASQYVRGKTNTVRGLSALITRAFSEMNGPYRTHIEQPFKKPPCQGTQFLRFHRTAVSFAPLAKYLLNGKPPSQRVINEITGDIGRVWQGIGLALGSKVYDPAASYGLTHGDKDWSHGHLFSIIQNAIVTPLIVRLIETNKVGSINALKIGMDLSPVLTEFFEYGLSDKGFSNGFRGISGSSTEGPYIEKLSEIFTKHFPDTKQVEPCQLENDDE